MDNSDLFPDFSVALKAEEMFMTERDMTKEHGIPSSDYQSAKNDLNLNLIDIIKSQTCSSPLKKSNLEDKHRKTKRIDTTIAELQRTVEKKLITTENVKKKPLQLEEISIVTAVDEKTDIS